MRPIFFSVSGKEVLFAEEIWNQFPSDLIYLYSKNGEVGRNFWNEILESELPMAQGAVVFWSKSFTEAEWTVKELTKISKLFQEGTLRHVLVLRLDDFPIFFDDSMAADTKPIFDSLSPVLQYRTSPASINIIDGKYAVEKFVESVRPQAHSIYARTDLIDAMMKRALKDRFTCYPAVWVSGFNGVGRQTLIREVNRFYAPDAKGFVVDISEASIPKRLLLRLEDEALGADLDRLTKIQSDPALDGADALAATIQRIFDAGHYVIFRQQRIVEERIELPTWLDEVANALKPGNRPKLFIVSQIPISAERRNRCRESMTDLRVPTVAVDELTEFAWRLIGEFDDHPERWDQALVESVAAAAGGNFGLLVPILRTASTMEDLGQIAKFAEDESDQFAENLTVYTRWAFAQIAEQVEEPRALVFLNDVSPCDPDDLAKVLDSARPISNILGKLIELGLVERDFGGLYRLTPLLSRRLSRDLLAPQLLEWQRDALRRFARTPINFEAADHEYVQIEARIQASLLEGDGPIPDNLTTFLSAAHWFQIGIRLYHARRYDKAYKILKKAFAKRDAFKDVSRVELTRYFGLSAVRAHKGEDVAACVQLLNSDVRSKDLAVYLVAYQHEMERRFLPAVKSYEEALAIAKNSGRSERLQRIFRALINCILRTPRPDYQLAETYALESHRLRKTVFSVFNLAKVYLNWWYKGEAAGREIPANIWDRYLRIAEELQRDPGVGSAYNELRAEEAELEGDIPAAVGWLELAIGSDGRPELRLERWRLMTNKGNTEMVHRALTELEQASRAPFANWDIFLERLTEVYVKGLKSAGMFSPHKVSHFAPKLDQHIVGRIVGAANRLR